MAGSLRGDGETRVVWAAGLRHAGVARAQRGGTGLTDRPLDPRAGDPGPGPAPPAARHSSGRRSVLPRPPQRSAARRPRRVPVARAPRDRPRALRGLAVPVLPDVGAAPARPVPRRAYPPGPRRTPGHERGAG